MASAVRRARSASAPPSVRPSAIRRTRRPGRSRIGTRSRRLTSRHGPSTLAGCRRRRAPAWWRPSAVGRRTPSGRSESGPALVGRRWPSGSLARETEGERREESPEGDLRRHPHRCHHVSGRTPAGRREPVHIGPDAGSDPSLPLPSSVSSELGRSGPAATGALALCQPLIGNPFTQAYGLAQGSSNCSPSDSVEFVRCPRRGWKSPVWTAGADWRRIQRGLRHRDAMAGEHSGCRQFHAQPLQSGIEHRAVHRWRPDGLRHWWCCLRPNPRPDRRSRSRWWCR